MLHWCQKGGRSSVTCRASFWEKLPYIWNDSICWPKNSWTTCRSHSASSSNTKQSHTTWIYTWIKPTCHPLMVGELPFIVAVFVHTTSPRWGSWLFEALGANVIVATSVNGVRRVDNWDKLRLTNSGKNFILKSVWLWIYGCPGTLKLPTPGWLRDLEPLVLLLFGAKRNPNSEPTWGTRVSPWRIADHLSFIKWKCSTFKTCHI